MTASATEAVPQSEGADYVELREGSGRWITAAFLHLQTDPTETDLETSAGRLIKLSLLSEALPRFLDAEGVDGGALLDRSRFQNGSDLLHSQIMDVIYRYGSIAS